MTLQRRDYVGAAPQTNLSGAITSSSTSFVLVSGTGYPVGANGPFVLVLDPNGPTEEKVLCASRAGATVTVNGGVAGRGYDGTIAAAHNGDKVQHVLSAADCDDWNAHVYTTGRDDHTQYARTDGTRPITGTQTLANATVTGAETVGGALTAGSLTVTGNETVGGTLAVTGALGVTGISTLTGGVVSAYATGAARDAAIPAPVPGTVAYLKTNDGAEGLSIRTSAGTWRPTWNIPWGLVIWGQSTSVQPGIGSTTVDVTGLSVTWTAVASRLYRTTVFLSVCNIASATTGNCYITDGANVIKQGVGMTVLGFTMIICSVIEGGLPAGSTIRKARVSTSGGNMDLDQSASQPAQIIVEDLGQNGAPT